MVCEMSENDSDWPITDSAEDAVLELQGKATEHDGTGFSSYDMAVGLMGEEMRKLEDEYNRLLMRQQMNDISTRMRLAMIAMREDFGNSRWHMESSDDKLRAHVRFYFRVADTMIEVEKESRPAADETP